MKRPYLWITLFSGISFFSCREDDTEVADLIGNWNLSQHYYSAPGWNDTTTYAAGDVVYKFYEDKSLYIEVPNQEIQLRQWETNEDGDSLFFDVGAPWAISNASTETFTAQFQPFLDAYSTYVFTRVE